MASIVGLLVAWFSIPYYNIGGVCIAFAVYMLIQIGFYYLYYWPKKMEISSTKVFFKSFIPFVSIGILSYLFVDNVIISISNTFYRFFLRGVCFALMFALLTYFSLNKADKQFFRNIKK